MVESGVVLMPNLEVRLFNVNRFPYSIVDYITTKHATHHIDMKRGNYSTLSPLYDWMFGTLE